ncbi:MAG: uroporphyrinogen-III C-methyltransferase [Oceanospirillaceae bacterium]|nr:uroporphyrinogen-III C-methyltransferase [Oceanospirillaceae bacterium]
MAALTYFRSARPLWNGTQLIARLSRRFHREPQPAQGHVSLIGAGPGDPELITRKGWRLLLAADVIVYDALVSDLLMEEIPAHIRRIYVGKRKGAHSASQEQICRLLVSLAQQGLNVARLKGGDPLVFGRLTEELAALKVAGIAFDLVPGITAAAGCAASCGIPLTERVTAPRLRMVTAHSCDDRPIDWADLARRDETLVFYMGLSMAPTISQQLQQHGLPADWPVLLVERGTQPDQRSIPTRLDQMAQEAKRHNLSGPTLILVGMVTQGVQPSEPLESLNLKAESEHP